MENYLKRGVWLTVLVVLLLLGLSLVSWGEGSLFRRVNILSHVVSDSVIDSWLGRPSQEDRLSEEVMAVGGREASGLKGVGVSGGDSSQMAEIDQTISDSLCAAIYARAIEGALPGVVPVEDYSEIGQVHFVEFLDRLASRASAGRPVRIAVLGDSFVESDLMTSDLRQMMQREFGGAGVGCAQISSEQAPFTRAMVHRWGGWRRISAMNRPRGARYLPSLLVYEPEDASGAYVEWTLQPQKFPQTCYTRARLLYMSRSGGVSVRATINGRAVDYPLPGGGQGQLSELTIVSPDSTQREICNLRLDFSKAKGLVLYGALLETETGVSVDNYSVRGNSGTLLAQIDHLLTQQMQAMCPVDLVVMSYGLNVVSASQVNYSAYMEQMSEALARLRGAMPGVPVLMLSVSDRLTRTQDGSLSTMRGVIALERAQRHFAQQHGLAFWSVYRAMEQMGGMEAFAAKGWGAKDYTHIGAAGGRRVAGQLFSALMMEYNRRMQHRGKTMGITLGSATTASSTPNPAPNEQPMQTTVREPQPKPRTEASKAIQPNTSETGQTPSSATTESQHQPHAKGCDPQIATEDKTTAPSEDSSVRTTPATDSGR